MATKYPRVIEQNGRVVGVELVEDCFLTWRRKGDGWVVQIGMAGAGVNVRAIDVEDAGVSVAPAIH
jgi:hypothetical protein